MTPFRLLLSVLFLAVTMAAAPVSAQQPTSGPDRSATGGAQTLEDILARQEGLKVDDEFRRTDIGDPNAAAATTDYLGTLGGVSDPEFWRSYRFGSGDVISSSAAPASSVVIQDSGITWLKVREGPLRLWGGYAILGMLLILIAFYLFRGKIRIESGRCGISIERFKPLERFGHWLVAGSFILLGITGLVSLFGRVGLMPWMGKDGFSTVALASKWIHNNVSWAFILGLILIFVMWVLHNLPHKHDVNWLLKAGGLFSKHSHPPARKFNAGQKIIFWVVILIGAAISTSGVALLFPFEFSMFTKTFIFVNDLGLPGLVGLEPLPTALTPHAEMQLLQLWHSILAFTMIAVIVAHIYLGSVGMEGAFDAMGDGHVDLNWAKEHHSLWVDEEQAKSGAEPPVQTPAE